MITVTHTETRPTLSVSWHKTPIDFISHIQKYNNIRHRTVYGWTSSPDMLSRTAVATYNSQVDYDTFRNDPKCVEETNRIIDHNTINSIIRVKTIS